MEKNEEIRYSDWLLVEHEKQQEKKKVSLLRQRLQQKLLNFICVTQTILHRIQIASTQYNVMWLYFTIELNILTQTDVLSHKVDNVC